MWRNLRAKKNLKVRITPNLRRDLEMILPCWKQLKYNPTQLASSATLMGEETCLYHSGVNFISSIRAPSGSRGRWQF